ncbi:hypothetical protein VTO42DRAFT_457 [Malbranchea cinnamomea]
MQPPLSLSEMRSSSHSSETSKSTQDASVTQDQTTRRGLKSNSSSCGISGRTQISIFLGLHSQRSTTQPLEYGQYAGYTMK